jgi:hypothetical protein
MFFWDLLRCGEVIHPPRWKKVTALRLRFVMFYLWLVVEPPLWKIWKSMGRIIPYMKWKIKFMFQTTNSSSDWIIGHRS